MRIGDGSLEVELLDPAAAHPAHGSRYCRGGYVWQVRDGAGRDLLSGPEHPHPTPTAFNGQGLPEVFRHAAKQGDRPLTQRADGSGLIIGIGRCLGGFTPGSVELTEAVPWQVEVTADRAVATCADTWLDWSYALRRTVAVEAGVLRITSELHNSAATPLPLQWYAHPFFAHRQGLNRCRFHATPPALAADAPGYTLRGGELAMRPEGDWTAGHFQWLELPSTDWRIDVTVDHPLRPGIRMSGDFPVECLPVWANARTLSLEPYLRRDLAPGETARWQLRYDFAAPGP